MIKGRSADMPTHLAMPKNDTSDRWVCVSELMVRNTHRALVRRRWARNDCQAPFYRASDQGRAFSFRTTNAVMNPAPKPVAKTISHGQVTISK